MLARFQEKSTITPIETGCCNDVSARSALVEYGIGFNSLIGLFLLNYSWILLFCVWYRIFHNIFKQQQIISKHYPGLTSVFLRIHR